MSGIVGMINLDGAPLDRQRLRQMTDFMTYRGPDAQQIWIDGAAGFGHTMLRTTDESCREQQPITLDGHVWITADARIDGQLELKALLEAAGRCDVKAATDVELILHAFHVWGEDCVTHLLGDFAFAIWDGRQQRLFCARDHFGVKLFYYAHVANFLIFSNTLNCIRQHPEVSTKLNELAIGDFLLVGYNPVLTTTSFSEIQRLPPAHILTWSNGMLRTKRYWRLSTEGRTIRYQRDSDYVDHFKALLREAVGDRLRTGRIAIFMSGGLDSPTLAATVCELRRLQAREVGLRAYCCVYDHLPDDERYYSGLVADALSIPIQYIAVDRYKMFEGWELREMQRPEPYNSPLLAITHDLSRSAMTYSRVVLYGEDGDAMFFPASVVDMLKGMPLGQAISDVGRYVLSHRRRPMLGLGLLKKLKNWHARQSGDDEFPPWIDNAFATRLSLRDRWTALKNPEPLVRHRLRPDAYQFLTAPFWQPLFESLDPGVTTLPVEQRLPLLDVRLVNYLMSIPPLPWCMNKELLRTAMQRVLPEAVLRRPKTPLSFDPYQVRLQKAEGAWLDACPPSPLLSRYVDRSLVPRMEGAPCEPNSSWRHLRPMVLNYWLNSQTSSAIW